MAECKYCGQNAGWFKEAHTACVTASRNGFQQISSSIAAAVAAGKPYSEIRSNIEQTMTSSRIRAEDFHNALVGGLSTGAEKLALAEPLSLDKHSAFQAFVRDAGLTQEGLVKTDGYKAVLVSMLLWCLLNGQTFPFRAATKSVGNMGESFSRTAGETGSSITALAGGWFARGKVGSLSFNIFPLIAGLGGCLVSRS